jgi:hypothetical protein
MSMQEDGGRVQGTQVFGLRAIPWPFPQKYLTSE